MITVPIILFGIRAAFTVGRIVRLTATFLAGTLTLVLPGLLNLLLKRYNLLLKLGIVGFRFVTTALPTTIVIGPGLAASIRIPFETVCSVMGLVRTTMLGTITKRKRVSVQE